MGKKTVSKCVICEVRRKQIGEATIKLAKANKLLGRVHDLKDATISQDIRSYLKDF